MRLINSFIVGRVLCAFFWLTVLCAGFVGPSLRAEGYSGEPIWIFDPNLNIQHVDTADVNGDGTADIFAGEYDMDHYGDPSLVYALDGKTGDTIWTYQLQDGCRAMTSGDLNSDGIPDVVAGASYNASATPDGNVHAIDGVTGAQLWTYYIGTSVNDLVVCNLNGDAFGDVVVGSFDDYIIAIDGRNGAFLWHYYVGSLWANAVAAGDVNNDGIDDIGYCHEYLTGYTNKYGILDGTDGSVIWANTDVFINLDVMITDIDADDTLEAIFTGEFDDEHAEIFVRNALTGDIEWNYNFGETSILNGTILLFEHDIDQDGDPDLVIGNEYGQFLIYAFDGDTNTPMWVSDTLSGYPVDIAFGDVTGDGSINIIAATYDRVQVLFSENGKKMWYYSVAGTIKSVAAAQIDDDGILDVVAGGAADLVGTNPGKGVWTLKTVQTPLLWEFNFGQYGNAMALGDLNNDGCADAVAVASLDDWCWAIDGNSGVELWHWTGTENLYAVAVGDFNNDNQLDVAVAGNDDMVTALNGANGGILWQFPDPTNQIYRNCLAAADLNGDGNVEVIAGCDNGTVYAIRGEDGSILWSTPVGAEVNEVELRQMNGTGPVDVLVAVGGNAPAGARGVVLDGSDGSEIWAYSAGTAVSCIEALDGNEDDQPDIALGTAPYAPRQVIMVDWASQTQMWALNIDIASGVYGFGSGDFNNDKIGDLLVAGGSTDKTAYALSGDDGSELWHFTSGGEINRALVYDIDLDGFDEGIIGSDDQNIYVLNNEDGTVEWNYSTADDVMDIRIDDISCNGLPNMACLTFGADGIVYAFSSLATGPLYTCGDANGDETANVGDVVYIINYVFNGGPAPDPLESGDVNCDSSSNVADAVYLINYVFKSGPAPCANCP